MLLPTGESFYGPRLRRALGRIALAADDTHGDQRWLTLADETGVPSPYWAAFLYADEAAIQPAATDDSNPLVAHVRHGRWLIQCECGSCQYACELDRRFYCVTCHNNRTDGRYRTVVWPDNPAAIERALRDRPRNRQHWLPHETLADLEQQNQQLAAMAA